VAEGDVIAGLTGEHQQRYQFLGAALALAERHQRRARPGEVRVRAALAAAAAAGSSPFRFVRPGAGAASEGGGCEDGDEDVCLEEAAY
jgi:class 3 adenylate cyclase